MKAITVKYAGVCAGCAKPIRRGSTALWDSTSRRVWHSDIDCAAKAASGAKVERSDGGFDVDRQYEDDCARACGLL